MIILAIYNFLNDCFLSMPLSTSILWNICYAILCIVCIAYLVGRCLIFKKIGIASWKGLIPFYGFYLLGNKVWVRILSIFTIVILLIFLAFELFCESIYSNLLFSLIYMQIMIIEISIFIVFLIFWFIYQLSLSKSFNQNIFFAIGLFLLPSVFYIVLGANKNKYIGNITRKIITELKKKNEQKTKDAYEKALKKKDKGE